MKCFIVCQGWEHCQSEALTGHILITLVSRGKCDKSNTGACGRFIYSTHKSGNACNFRNTKHEFLSVLKFVRDQSIVRLKLLLDTILITLVSQCKCDKSNTGTCYMFIL